MAHLRFCWRKGSISLLLSVIPLSCGRVTVDPAELGGPGGGPPVFDAGPGATAQVASSTTGTASSSGSGCYEPIDDPTWELCRSCPGPATPCALLGCLGSPDPDGNVCAVSTRAPGQPCVTGVGTCDAHGDCRLPAADCVVLGIGYAGVCGCPGDCDDENPCTADSCSIWCLHQPTREGENCAPGRVCRSGACCAQ